MSFICNLCSSNFTQRHVLQRHLAERRCKSILVTDLIKLNNLLEDQKQKLQAQEIIINGNNTISNNTISNCNNVNFNIEIKINPVSKLDTLYIDIEKIKEFIDIYDDARFKILASNKPDQLKNPERINIALGDYIKEIIYRKDHPENHSVKYTKKDPPTFNSLTEDKEGNTINVIKGLKDTCELLTDPILDQLKIKIKEFVKKYKKDDDFDILYIDTIQALRLELNKKTVKKALSSVLKNDILNDIEMKLNIK